MTDDTEGPKDSGNVINLFQDLVTAEHPDGGALYEHIYTNDLKNPMLPKLFHFIYDAVFNNKVGVMHAYNTETKQVQTILVGVELDSEGGVMCLPLAKILTSAEQENYLAPDGLGNWIGLDPDDQ